MLYICSLNGGGRGSSKGREEMDARFDLYLLIDVREVPPGAHQLVYNDLKLG